MDRIIKTMFNLSLTPRWVGHITTFKDTTATHSFRVAILTLVASIIKKNKYNIDIDVKSAVLKAIFHDYNEDKIGPIKHKTKKSKETERALQKLERDQAKEILLNFPGEIYEEFYAYVVDGENETLEGKLVDLVDSFDALLFCFNEKTLQKRDFFNKTYEEIRERLILENDETINFFIESLETPGSPMGMFFSSVFDLSGIQRWSGRYNTMKDDVAGHTFRMASLAAILCELENKSKNKPEKIDTLRIIGKILFHDIPETIYGDVRGPIKNSTPEVADAFNELELKISKDLCSWVPEEIRSEIEDFLIHAKNYDMVEGVYVDIFDKLDALNKSLFEVSRGNEEYKRVFAKIYREIKVKYGDTHLVKKYFSDGLLELQISLLFD